MRSRRPLLTLVLAAALLAGQWLAAAHEPDHALQPGAAHGCVVCVYAHGAGAGALPHVAVPSLAGAVEAPASAQVRAPRAALHRHHSIRGPPALLV